MQFAVVQKDSLAPTVEQLKAALKAVPRFTELDALRQAQVACGILARHLTLPEATLVQRALAGDGVPTEVVEASQLPRLPDAKSVKRLELDGQAMRVFDPLGRAVPVPWPQVSLLTAGVVRHFGVSQTVTQERVHRDYVVVAFDTIETDVRHKIEDTAKVQVDIFLAGGAMRFQIEAENFLFGYLFQRPELGLVEKTGHLIQLLSQSAPHVRLNRGAVALRDQPAQPVGYASKAALDDEAVWLLWRMAAQARSQGSSAAAGAV
ncbi:MAG: hypothetical protein HZA90_23915 [Verrucomicrobia bacterium]|nr:hypothetical protein [Verrucomicrobiota bacterium]